MPTRQVPGRRQILGVNPSTTPNGVPTRHGFRRKRRGSVRHDQNHGFGSTRFAVPDFRSPSVVSSRRSGHPRLDDPVYDRYRSRARKLTPIQEDEIRVLAGTRSLRSLAADFGVSHETVRVVKQTGADRT